MRKTIAAAASAAVLALGFIWIAAPLNTEAEGSAVLGAGDAGVVSETMRWKTLKGNYRKMTVSRLVIKVPRQYGELFHSSGGSSTTLWFRGENGIIRNVVLGNPSQLVQIEREP